MNTKNKPLTRKINLFHVIDGIKIEGAHKNILLEDVNKCRAEGDCTNVIGCISNGLFGDISGLYGDVTGFIGDASGVQGNVDSINKPVESQYHLETFTKVIL